MKVSAVAQDTASNVASARSISEALEEGRLFRIMTSMLSTVARTSAEFEETGDGTIISHFCAIFKP